MQQVRQLGIRCEYRLSDKVLFRQTYCENIFRKSVKNQKISKNVRMRMSRETTKLVIIISNREHTLDVISKAFILFFGHVGRNGDLGSVT